MNECVEELRMNDECGKSVDHTLLCKNVCKLKND